MEPEMTKPTTIELGISDVIRPSGGFTDGAHRRVVPGDRVQYRFKPEILGTVGDIMCDGEADVAFDDGTFDTVKWRNLAKWIDEAKPDIDVSSDAVATFVHRWGSKIGELASFVNALAADRDHLAKERDEANDALLTAKTIIRNTLWMAQRYANGRRSYAVGMYNDAARRAFEHKFVEPDRDSTGWALDGTKQADYAGLDSEENAEALKNFNTLAVAEADLSAAIARAEKAEAERDNAKREVSRLRRDGEWYQYAKRGGIYSVVGTAKLQTETPLSDMAEVTIYVSHIDGELWARPPSEFNDGRFIGPLPRGHKTDEPIS